MARKFQIDDSITVDIKSAASDSFKDNIRMIEINKIKASMDNFYSMNEIEMLADDIERQGLKHNLVVTEDSENLGTFFIKSGHRRFTAIQHLVSENRYGSKFVPCLVDGEKTRYENILDLIMLNATTRVMSDSEMFKQYETLKETLEQLKNNGIKVKGRLREKVAEMLNISPAQVGKIENIKHNAVDEIKEAVENGNMSIATADSIAKLSEEEQQELISENEISKIKTKDVKKRKEQSKTKAAESEKETQDFSEKSEDDYSDFEDKSLTENSSLSETFEEAAYETEDEIAESDNDFSEEIISDTEEKIMPDPIEIYRSKLLEANAGFADLIRNADTFETIQEAAVDMINKITDIQMEVANG